jgi:chromate reductase, NAD(P)H dehydrogenase (quinone)
VRILALGGSLREASFNRALLHEAAALAPEIDLGLVAVAGALPLFDQDILDRDGPPAEVLRLKEALAAADGLLLGTPEYNWSIPGFLKNAIDWASRPKADAALRNKPVAVIGASTGMFGAVWAQAELRKVLARTGARVLEGELAVPFAHSQFDEEGRLQDEELRARLREVAERLVAETAALSVAA